MNTFREQQAQKILSCYNINKPETQNSELEKAQSVGYINAHGKQKQADGTWKYVGKAKKEEKTTKFPQKEGYELVEEGVPKDLRSTKSTKTEDNSKSKIQAGDKVVFHWQPDMSSRLQKFDGKVVEIKSVSESGKYIDWYVPGSDKLGSVSSTPIEHIKKV